MKLTNLLGLSDDVVAAVSADRYDPGRPAEVPADRYFTTTQLIQPEQMLVLKERHRDDITEDVADRIYSLLGDSVHLVLERVNSSPYDRIVRAAREIKLAMSQTDTGYSSRPILDGLRVVAGLLRGDEYVLRERRLYMKLVVDGVEYTIGGALDNLVIKGGVLTDWKLTSVFSTKEGPKDEWVRQNRINTLLCVENGYPINRAQNCVIYRDWRKAEAARRPNDYPQKGVEEIPTYPEPAEVTRAWIIEKIRAIVAARRLASEVLPECSASDRWQKKTTWAVKKRGNKRAERGGIFAEEVLAQEFAIACMTKGGVYEVEHRPGVSTRCAGGWCAVMPFCSQAKRLGVSAESAEEESDG